jgi:hypothetical protein
MLPEAPLVVLRHEAEEAVSLSGKVALVTGSTNGIGLGIALPVDGGWTAQ